jgi:hypothetical protein
MKATQEPTQPSQAINDEPVLDADELKTFAKLLDVLMVADFEINRNKGLVANAC